MPNLRAALDSIYTRIQQRRELEESTVIDVSTDNDFFKHYCFKTSFESIQLLASLESA